MARSNRTFLMKGTKSGESVTWAKFLDIKDYPDFPGEREQLENTTLSDDAQTWEEGIRSQEALQFTHNYTLADFQKAKAAEGVVSQWAIWFGGTGRDTPTGEDGKFEFEGKLSCSVIGKGSNEVREFRSTIMPTNEVELVTD